MVFILGNSAKKVELNDLRDVVYYKQQKTISNSDYERSSDLKREIKSGRILVLKETNDSTPSGSVKDTGHNFLQSERVCSPTDRMVASPVVVEKEVIREVIVEKEVPANLDNSKLDLLLNKLLSLEAKINESPKEDKGTLFEGFMASVEERLGNIEGGSLRDSSKGISTDTKIDTLIDLIKSGVLSNGTPSSPNIKDYAKPKTVDEVYVPTIRVEDANAKVNLQTRVIEGGSQVNDALSALKAMKNNK